jgi:DNA-binding CsgD family transcriptional regulator
MSLTQKILLGLFLLFASIYGSIVIIDELHDLFTNGESIWNVAFEIFFALISYIGLLYFTYIIYQQHTSQNTLEQDLSTAKLSLESANIKLRNGKKEFFKVIQWQFSEWLLSPSEAEVALLLLKGLSIKEIAEARATQEKTVRKQASAIYEKSGLAGRHELSAWFFEDLL